MTDRLKGVVVTFEEDIRDDDAQEIINAILMIKGVKTVATSIANHDDHMNRSRIRLEYRQKLFDALKD